MSENGHGHLNLNGQQRKDRVVISRKQSIQASRWFDANWQAMKTMTRKQVAEAVGAHIGMEVTKEALNRLLKDADKEWPGLEVRQRNSSNPKTSSVKITARNLVRVACAVEFIAEQLGVNIPINFVPEYELLSKVCAGRSLVDSENEGK